jgi:hypothetical protein
VVGFCEDNDEPLGSGATELNTRLKNWKGV